MQEENEFGDFEETTEEDNNQLGEQLNIPTRVRMPRGDEKIGRIIQRLGGNRMDIKTVDGKIRNCKVPGRHRRKLWLRPKDFVLITPDKYNDNKGEIIYKYRPAEVNLLQKKGILRSLNDEF